MKQQMNAVDVSHCDEFVGVEAAAELLGVCVATIYRWRFEQKIPYRKHGRLVRFSKSDLLQWSKRSEVKPYSARVRF